MQQQVRGGVLLLLANLILACKTAVLKLEWSALSPLVNLEDPILVNQDQSSYDQAHFICPVNSSSLFSVFLVSQKDYELCSLTSKPQRYKKIAECGPKLGAKPRPPIIISFRQFSPLPGGLEFTPGETYYFLSHPSPTALRSVNQEFRPPAEPSSPSEGHSMSPNQHPSSQPCQTNLRVAFHVGSTRSRVNVPRSMDTKPSETFLHGPGDSDALHGPGDFGVLHSPGDFDALHGPGDFDALHGPGDFDALDSPIDLDALRSAPAALSRYGSTGTKPKRTLNSQIYPWAADSTEKSASKTIRPSSSFILLVFGALCTSKCTVYV